MCDTSTALLTGMLVCVVFEGVLEPVAAALFVFVVDSVVVCVVVFMVDPVAVFVFVVDAVGLLGF